MDANNEIKDPIIEMCKGGDTKAFQQLYELYAKRVYNTILRIVRNRTDAEDLLQETFVNIFKNIKNYHYQSHFSYWIKRIAINNSITHLRKNKEWIEYDADKQEHVHIEESNYTIDHLKVAQIKEAISKIPLIYSTVFSLYVFEGYDHEEISEILDISHNTVRTRYVRAKEKIKSLIIQMNSYA